MRVDDPCGESETNANGLLAVWMAVFEEVAPDLFVGEGLVCLCEFDKVLIGVVNGLTLCELHGVWVAVQEQISGEWVECEDGFYYLRDNFL